MGGALRRKPLLGVVPPGLEQLHGVRAGGAADGTCDRTFDRIHAPRLCRTHAWPPLGTLYLVATPIGNLEDVSPRALKVLQEVHMVACEDTRHTQILLRRHEIRAKHLTSYTEVNHRRKAAELVGQMDRGWDVALVTDAGTPGLSDPGEQLVAAAIANGHEVLSIPGPAAAIAALVASGLPTREFTFVGFPEKKSGALRREHGDLLDEGRTLGL